MNNKIVNILTFNTKIGWITVKEESNMIISIGFKKSKNIGNSVVLKNFKKNFKNYLLKRTKILNSKILMTGTTLQIKIWKELRKIPYGKTKSYGEIAAKVKTSPRYVGNVCGQNKHLVAIPCHRVIKGDGSLGGFSAPGGIKTKRKMLNLEGFKI